MPSSEQDAGLRAAVKQLRLAIGLSQQAFAVKLGLAVRTVWRWERGVAPKGKALAQLRALARSHALFDIYWAFDKALREELSITGEAAIAVPITLEEEIVTHAILILMRVDPSAWPERQNPARAIISDIGKAIEGLVEMRDDPHGDHPLWEERNQIPDLRLDRLDDDTLQRIALAPKDIRQTWEAEGRSSKEVTK
jgi:transcriptional regulator with XRE-family HTH domain